MSRPRCDHVGLAVTDLASSTRWYCEAFDFRRERDLAVPAIDLTIVMLQDLAGFRLELLHRPGNDGVAKPATPAEAALRKGFGHLAFDVAGLDDEHARILALGATEVMSPQPSPEPGVRMSFLADPEGNLIELLERSAERAAANT